jgi:hypothetical protein
MCANVRTLEKTDGFDKPTGFCDVRQLDVRRACQKLSWSSEL